MLTASSIFIELKSSTLVPNLYGLIRRILYLIYIAPHSKFTVPLVKKCVITKGNIYGVSNFYELWLLSMTLSTTL